jgi:septum formation protein
MSAVRLILASGSPQRRTLLAEAGYEFEVVAPREEVECGICSTGGPAALVTELAMSKAVDVVAQLKDRGELSRAPRKLPPVIIACDTVAECGGEVLGKPADEDHARSMLQRLRGSVHRVYSGLCIWQPTAEAGGSADANLHETSRPDVRLAVSELRMDAISDEDLDDYLASGQWQGKAGAFGIQDRPGWLHLLSGSESNVVGLPMELVRQMLAQRGLEPTGGG